MRDGMQVTHRGKIGPATLSKPEVQGASEISAQEEYESGTGRKVPRPSEQTRQQALRGLGLKAQAKDRSLRDKVVRGGGVKKKRQIDPSYKMLSTRSVPQWGGTNVSLIGDSSDALDKSGAVTAKGGLGNWFKGLLQPKAVKTPVTPKVAPKVTPKTSATPKPAVKGAKPKFDEARMRKIIKQTASVADPGADILGMAQQHGMKVSPWAKMVNNPYGGMLMQMAAMSAIEPVMHGLGINSPILGGVLPFMAMQSLPGMLESSAGIPRMRSVLQGHAERGRLGQPIPRLGQPPIPMPQQTPQPAASPVKVASVAIPRITTVLG